MLYPIKVEFREYPNGIYTDWSEYVTAPPIINRRVESENEGEAGVIVFDEAEISFRYEINNPVYSAFSIDLTNKQRYLFKISAYKSDLSFVPLFEGMADFSTIEFNENETEISFKIVDKISALGLLPSYPIRGSAKNLLYDKNTDITVDSIDIATGAAASSGHHKWINMLYKDNTLIKPTIDSNTPALGDIIQSPYDLQSLALVIFKGKRIDHQLDTDPMYLDLISNDATYPLPSGNQKTVNNLFYYINEIYGVDLLIKEYQPSYTIYYQDAGNEIPITLQGGYKAIAYDGIKLIEAIVRSQWPEIITIKKPSSLTYYIPLDYYLRLIYEAPLDTDPLSALKILADSMQCYIYIDRNGNLVIQEKAESTLPTSGITREIGTTHILSSKRKYFWDKLVDGATVEVRSWVIDPQTNEFLIGRSTKTKQLPGSNVYVKPKNEIKKSVLAPNQIPPINTQELLNAHAAEIADTILNFYGKRRAAYTFELNLDDNTIEWELLDNILFNNAYYFFTSLEINCVERTVTLEAIEVAGHDYDPRQVVIALSDENVITTYSSIPSTETIGSGASGSETMNLTSQIPLELIGSLLKLNYTDNFRLSINNQLDTIQDIKPTSTTIKFERIGFGGDADLNYRVTNYGDEWIWGNQKIDGSQAIGGVIDTNFKQKIYGHAKITGNLTVDGDIYIGGVINQVNIVDLNIADHTIRLNKGGDNSTALDGGIKILGTNDATVGSIIYKGTRWLSDLDFDIALNKAYKINNVEVLNATTLGSGVINSSLTKVGTLTTGIWNATPIDGQYINYNTTNLKVTSNQLNTIQDISITASPTFANINLTGTVNQQGGGTNYFYGDIKQSGSRSIYNNFISGWSGSGWRIDYDVMQPNKSYLEIDNLTVRGTMSIYELLLNQIRATNGNVITSDAAKVDSASGNQITFEDPSNHNVCPFAINDLIIAQSWDASGTIVRQVKATVTSVSGRTITVTYNTGTAQKGDTFIRVGNTTNASRQGLVYTVTSDAYAPYIDIINGVNSWTAWGSSSKTKARYGNLEGITDANFGALTGYGLYAQNVYLKGKFYLTNLSQTVEDALNTKVSQTEFDNLSNTVATHTTQITQNANNITLKADITYVDSLNDRLTNAEASITVNADAITSEVTNRINADNVLQSQITQNANNINLKVSKNDVINQINISTEGVGIAAKKIDITGTTTFYNGQTLASAINSGTTTISGSKIRSGAIQSNNYSGYSGTYFDLNNGDLTINAEYGSVALYGATRNYPVGLNVIGKATNGIQKILVQAGAYNDDSYARYGFSIWDNTNNVFLMNIGYSPGQSNFIAKISNWNITKDWLADDNLNVVIDATDKSIYARPLGTGNKTKYVMLGQTHNGTNWTGYYGISAVDGNNNFIFRLDDYETKIAGWNIDSYRLYKLSGSAGIELSTSAFKTVSSGFAVWDPSSPKLFIGDNSSNVDWNYTASNTLTIKGGKIQSSEFSTTNTFIYENSFIGSIVQSSGVYVRAIGTISNYWSASLTGEHLWIEEDIGGNPRTITGRGIFISANSATRHINIDNHNVIKFYGVTNSPSSTNKKEGDFYINTSNKVFIWNGSTWIQLN